MPKSAPELQVIGIDVDRSREAPLYLQLYENIKQAILNGSIRRGQRLPSSRQLATALSISRNIVGLAFEQLAMEGFLSGKVGSGTYISDTIPDNFIRTEERDAPEKRNHQRLPFPLPAFSASLLRNQEVEPILPFQNAVPAMDLFPFKVWAKIASHTHRYIDKLHLGYGDASGYLPLKESIANYLRTSRGVRCEPDQIVITNGAQQALSLSAHMLTNKRDKVVIEDPGYPGARSAFQAYGTELLPAPVGEDGVDVDFIKKKYRKPRLIYVTPSQQYPLGGTLGIDKRMDLLDWAFKENTWVIEDDYDSELRYKGRPLAALQGIDNRGHVIYIGTFSKVLFPALRIGYIVLPTSEMAMRFSTLKAALDRQIPIADQFILNAFIQEGHFERHLRRMRLAYQERQAMLIRAIEKDMQGRIRVQEQDAGMHLMGWLDPRSNDKEVSAVLARYGVIAHPLSDYTLHFKRDPGLLLGYTAFNKFRVRTYVQKMNAILSKLEQ